MGSAMSVGFLMPRYLQRNAVAGLIALGVWMAIDLIYVFWADGNAFFARVTDPLIFLVAVIAFMAANWRLVAGGLLRRFMKTALLSLPAFLVWLMISTITILWFHPFIGGTE